MAEIDLAALATRMVYGFLMSAVVPRPIAIVTTVGPGGVVNAAPFSSFIALSPKPPLVGFIVGGWEGRRKDTLANIERGGEFVANTVTESMAMAVQACAAELPPGESEVAHAKLTTRGSVLVAPPRLADSPIALECRLEKIVPLGDAPDNLLVGRILRAHVADALWHDDKIDRAAWHPLGRQGGGQFWPTQPVLERSTPRQPQIPDR